MSSQSIFRPVEDSSLTSAYNYLSTALSSLLISSRSILSNSIGLSIILHTAVRNREPTRTNNVQFTQVILNTLSTLFFSVLTVQLRCSFGGLGFFVVPFLNVYALKMIRKINTAIDPGVALHLISFARALNESSRRQVNRATPPGSPRRRARSTLLSLNPAGQWTRQGHCYASDVYPIPSQPRSADEPILPGQQNKRLPGQRR